MYQWQQLEAIYFRDQFHQICATHPALEARAFFLVQMFSCRWTHGKFLSMQKAKGPKSPEVV